MLKVYTILYCYNYSSYLIVTANPISSQTYPLLIWYLLNSKKNKFTMDLSRFGCADDVSALTFVTVNEVHTV